MLWDDENGEGATIGGGEREGEGEEPMERTVEQAWYGRMDFEIFETGRFVAETVWDGGNGEGATVEGRDYEAEMWRLEQERVKGQGT